MSLQYLSDEKGQIVAVQVPIKEWKQLKSKYPDLDPGDTALPDWQKDLIDSRLDSIKENPKRILPINSLIAELDRPGSETTDKVKPPDYAARISISKEDAQNMLKDIATSRAEWERNI